MTTNPCEEYFSCQPLNEGITLIQFIQKKVHISNRTTLPRNSSKRRGPSLFSQTSFSSSGAGPRFGSSPAALTSAGLSGPAWKGGAPLGPPYALDGLPVHPARKSAHAPFAKTL